MNVAGLERSASHLSRAARQARVVGRITTDERPPSGLPGQDRRIAALAAGQHGLVTRAQLLGLGVSPSAVTRRLSGGRLHAVHRGVYAVGHPLLTRRATELAAVLACGPRAVLSHGAAGALWGLVAWNGARHVTAPRSRGPVPGVSVHRTRGLLPAETTVCEGVPCTTWARTLLDLAGDLPVHRLARALEAAALAGMYDQAELTSVLDRAAGRRGAGRLREALARGHHLTPSGTRSVLEEAFLALIRCAPRPLPAPRTNAWPALLGDPTFEVDVLWKDERVVVELDGRRYHELEGARQRDRARDAALVRNGYTVIRLTWADVTQRPGRTLRRVERALGRIEPAQDTRSGPARRPERGGPDQGR